MNAKENEIIQTEPSDMWATVELMGHAQTAGRISRPSDWGGLLRVDVPTEEGNYRTEFYGLPAVYSIKLVSEEIARAYVTPPHLVVAYDSPIVTREEHRQAVSRVERENSELHRKINELERRLTAVKGLPVPRDEGEEDF